MARLILGSKSAHRKEIMSYFSLPFEQVDSLFDEDSIPFKGDSGQYVCELALGKAHSLIPRFPDETLLTADTIVFRQGKIYGKPQDQQEAFQTLSELAGNWHSVLTGVALYHQGKEYQAYEETKVLFNALTESQIRHYHSKFHWADKAGGYDIRMAGGLAIKKIDGCYYNVVGLPINSVHKLLLNIGIQLWDYLK